MKKLSMVKLKEFMVEWPPAGTKIAFEGDYIGEVLTMKELQSLTAEQLLLTIAGDYRAILRCLDGTYTLMDTQNNDYIEVIPFPVD